MMSTKRTAAPGSSSAPERNVSVAERTAAMGVRSSCDALATQGLEAAQLGDVDEDHEQPLVVARQRGRVHQQASRLEARQLDLGGSGARGAAGIFQQIGELGVTNGLDEQLAHRFGPDEQHRAQRGVDEHDVALPVDDHHALLHRFQDAALQVALRPELPEGRCQAARQAVERVPQLDHLVLALEAGAHGQIALAHPSRGVGERAHGRDHPVGHEVRQEERQRQRDRRAAPDEPPSAGVSVGRSGRQRDEGNREEEELRADGLQQGLRGRAEDAPPSLRAG
jgi:hypothetical protein